MRFCPIYQLSVHPCACYSLVSVFIPLGITPGLKMGLIPTVNSWFITGETDEGCKKLDTEFDSVADWDLEEQRLLSR